MKNWRKVLGSEFKDDFKPFVTENKVKLPNRAEFTGDEWPTKTGDPAQVELDAWHTQNKNFKGFRNKEKQDDYTSLIDVPEGHLENVKDHSVTGGKWVRRFTKFARNLFSSDIVGKGVRGSSIKKKSYVPTGQLIGDPQKNEKLEPLEGAVDAVLEMLEDEGHLKGRMKRMDTDSDKINEIARLLHKDGYTKNNIERDSDIWNYIYDTWTTLKEESQKKGSKNWRKVFAVGEPDVNMKRKPDGTMELNITHPNPEEENEEQQVLRQEQTQEDQTQNNSTQTADTGGQGQTYNYQAPSNTQTSAMRKNAVSRQEVAHILELLKQIAPTYKYKEDVPAVTPQAAKIIANWYNIEGEDTENVSARFLKNDLLDLRDAATDLKEIKTVWPNYDLGEDEDLESEGSLKKRAFESRRSLIKKKLSKTGLKDLNDNEVHIKEKYPDLESALSANPSKKEEAESCFNSYRPLAEEDRHRPWYLVADADTGLSSLEPEAYLFEDEDDFESESSLKKKASDAWFVEGTLSIERLKAVLKNLGYKIAKKEKRSFAITDGESYIWVNFSGTSITNFIRYGSQPTSHDMIEELEKFLPEAEITHEENLQSSDNEDDLESESSLKKKADEIGMKKSTLTKRSDLGDIKGQIMSILDKDYQSALDDEPDFENDTTAFPKKVDIDAAKEAVLQAQTLQGIIDALYKHLPDSTDFIFSRVSSLKKNASKDDVHEWIIRKEGNLTLLGRECKENVGIFLLQFPKGVLAKASALKNKLSFAIDKEVLLKSGHQWRELINEALWISKFEQKLESK